MITSSPLLTIEELNVEYSTEAGAARAVDGVSLSLRNGQTMGIVGESGCGKTTLALSILRLLPENGHITKGSVLFDGKDLASLDDASLRRIRWKEISIIFQGAMSALNPVFRVGDQLTQVLQLHTELSSDQADGVVASSFELVGLDPEYRFAYPHEYSGGMKQRAMIAMSLLLRPKLIIADEPTTALDVVVQAEILEEIKNLQRSLGISIILITHDIATVGEICDCVSVMYGGEIIESGPTDDVFRHPRHPYTLSLLSAYPSLDSKPKSLFKLRGKPPDLINPPDGCRFAERCFMVKKQCHEAGPDLVRIEGQRVSRCLFSQHVPDQLAGKL